MSDQELHHPTLASELAAAGISEDWLSEVAGVNRTTVWRWMSGRRPVPRYAATLVRQQALIKKLLAALCQARCPK